MSRAPTALLVGFAALSALAACAGARGEAPLQVPPQTLTGWEVRWSPPGTPGEDWKPVDLYAPVVHPSGGPGRGWFRVTLPRNQWTEPAVFLEYLSTYFTASIDGKEVYRFQPQGDRFVLPGAAWFLLRLPDGYEGQTLLLEVDSITSAEIGPESATRIGARSDLVLELLQRSRQKMALGLMGLLLGVVALMSFGRWRRETMFLALALYSASEGFSMLGTAPARLFLLDAPHLWDYGRWAARIGMPVGLALFTWLLFQRRAGYLKWLSLLAAVGAAAIGVLLAAGSLWGYVIGWRFINAVWLVLTCACGAAGVDAAWRKQPHARAYLLGFGLMAALSLLDTLTAMRLLPQGFEWSAYGYLAFVLALGWIATDRIQRTHRAMTAYAQELEHKEQALQSAIAARDDFLSVASHELRTPLATLALQAELLERHPSAAVAKDASMLRRQVDRLRTLSATLLDVSRAKSGDLQLDPEPMDACALLRELVERARVDAERAGCELTAELPERAAGTWDRLRLEQVFTNLLSNAFKYGAGQPVSVRAQVKDGALRVLVSDLGLGISPSDQARIFERFERAAPLRHYAGLGLGLWIAREIVRAHRGEISVESAEGKGACFTVVLPGAAEQAAALAG